VNIKVLRTIFDSEKIDRDGDHKLSEGCPKFTFLGKTGKTEILLCGLALEKLKAKKLALLSINQNHVIKTIPY